MATYNAGILIRSLRKQRGLSQEKLACGICDRRTISYIENGEITPGKYVFEKLMERLGLDPSRFSSTFSGSGELQFELFKLQIEQLLRHADYSAVNACLEEMRGGASFGENRFVRQYCLWTKAAVLGEGHEWREDAPFPLIFALLDEAIRITVPGCDEDCLQGPYSLVEVAILQMLGAAYLFSGRADRALRILSQLKALLETEYIVLRDRADTYTSLIVTTAKSYRYMELFQEAYRTCEDGLAVCAETGSTASLPWILYQKAVASHHLGRPEECAALFADAATIFRYYGENEMAAFTASRAIELLGSVVQA